MARETGLCLGRDGGAGVLRIANDESLDLRIGGMCGPRPMACLAHRNRRVRPIGHVQAQRMQCVREVVRFETVAGDAGFLADRLCVGRLRVGGDTSTREPGRRPGKTEVDGVLRGKIRRRKRVRIVPRRLYFSDRQRTRHAGKPNDGSDRHPPANVIHCALSRQFHSSPLYFMRRRC